MYGFEHISIPCRLIRAQHILIAYRLTSRARDWLVLATGVLIVVLLCKVNALDGQHVLLRILGHDEGIPDPTGPRHAGGLVRANEQLLAVLLVPLQRLLGQLLRGPVDGGLRVRMRCNAIVC